MISDNDNSDDTKASLKQRKMRQPEYNLTPRHFDDSNDYKEKSVYERKLISPEDILKRW